MTGRELQAFIREELLWSQEQFAKYIGIGPSAITRWIHGIYPIPGAVVRLVELLRTLRKVHEEFPRAARERGILTVEDLHASI